MSVVAREVLLTNSVGNWQVPLEPDFPTCEEHFDYVGCSSKRKISPCADSERSVLPRAEDQAGKLKDWISAPECHESTLVHGRTSLLYSKIYQSASQVDQSLFHFPMDGLTVKIEFINPATAEQFYDQLRVRLLNIGDERDKVIIEAAKKYANVLNKICSIELVGDKLDIEDVRITFTWTDLSGDLCCDLPSGCFLLRYGEEDIFCQGVKNWSQVQGGEFWVSNGDPKTIFAEIRTEHFSCYALACCRVKLARHLVVDQFDDKYLVCIAFAGGEPPIPRLAQQIGQAPEPLTKGLTYSRFDCFGKIVKHLDRLSVGISAEGSSDVLHYETHTWEHLEGSSQKPESFAKQFVLKFVLKLNDFLHLKKLQIYMKCQQDDAPEKVDIVYLNEFDKVPRTDQILYFPINTAPRVSCVKWWTLFHKYECTCSLCGGEFCLKHHNGFSFLGYNHKICNNCQKLFKKAPGGVSISKPIPKILAIFSGWKTDIKPEDELA